MNPKYVEAGGSWRPLWLAVGIVAVLAGCAALLPGADLPLLAWFAVVVAVPGIAAVGCLSARRAPVLGGGWSVPKGRVGLPLRRSDGRTWLVPTRNAAQLAEAIRTAHPVGGGRPAGPGTVGS